jgi:hypothetical protein
MRRKPLTQNPARAFAVVKRVALALPGVEATTRYDGSPVLKAAGVFMAGLASHPSAEPGTLVIKVAFEDRAALLEDAPETYYLTDQYRPHPVVLVRLSHISQDALRDLLAMSWRVTASARTRPKRRRQRPPKDVSFL